MSPSGGAGPAGLQQCGFSKAESAFVRLGGEPENLKRISGWGDTIVTQDSVLQDRGQSEWAAVVSIRFCILILTCLVYGVCSQTGAEKSFYNGHLLSKT